MKNILLLLVAGTFFMQQSHAQSFCGTNQSEDDYLKSLLPMPDPEGPYLVRVFVHKIRKSDGTGGITNTEVQIALNNLATDFAPHNICFSFKGEDEILSDYFYDTDFFTTSSALFTNNDHPDCIDIYFCPNSNPGKGGKASGTPGTNIVVGGTWVFSSLFCDYDCLDEIVYTSKILSHEMGHCLGLFYTFHGNDSCEAYGEAEFVDGTNCSDAGDFVCDTPADPCMNHAVDCSTCDWCLSADDINGDPYDPDELNIMGYPQPICMQYFSGGQGLRMRKHLETSLVLADRIVPNHTYIQNISASIGTKLYASLERISVGSSVTSGTTGPVNFSAYANTDLRTGKSILLEPGFKTFPNSFGSFHAYIVSDICSVTDQYNSSKLVSDAYHPFLDNSSWFSRISFFEGFNNKSYYLNSDTIIDGYVYRRLYESSLCFEDLDECDTTFYYYENIFIGYVREDIGERKVYFKNLTTEFLLYDFSLEVGEIFPGMEDFTVSVLDSVLTNDGFRKRIIFQNDIGNQVHWVEGIGNITEPFFNNNPIGNCQFFCYALNNELIYDYSTVALECSDWLKPIEFDSAIVNIDNSYSDAGIKIFPNPSSNILYLDISSANEKFTAYEVYAINGNKILAEKITDKNEILSFQLEKKGVYLLKLISENGGIVNRKIIIQ